MADLHFQENNCFHPLTPASVEKEYRIVLEFLRHHPIKNAFITQGTAPRNRLIEFWRTVDIKENAEGVKELKGSIGVDENDVVPVTFTPDDLNQALHVEVPADAQPPPDINEIKRCLGKLNFDDIESFSKAGHFNRKKLPLMYQFLFMMVNNCLTGKVGSTDQASMTLLQIFTNLFMVKNFDLGKLIFDAMTPAIKKKSAHISYVRFLSILVGEKAKEMGFSWSKNETAPNYYLSTRFTGGGHWLKDYLTTGELEGISQKMLKLIPDNSDVKKRYLGEVLSEEPQEENPSPSVSVTQTSKIQGKHLTLNL